MRIPIPFISIRNFGDSINSFFRTWNIIEENKNRVERIVLDFSDCRFSNPFLLLSIHLIYKKLKAEGVNIELKFNDNLASNFNFYLSLICFSKGLSLDGLNDIEITKRFEAFSSKTYLPLTYKTNTLRSTILILLQI